MEDSYELCWNFWNPLLFLEFLGKKQKFSPSPLRESIKTFSSPLFTWTDFHPDKCRLIWRLQHIYRAKTFLFLNRLSRRWYAHGTQFRNIFTSSIWKNARKKIEWDKTGVINDPLGQTHSHTSSEHDRFLLFCFSRFEKWGRANGRTDGQHVRKQWSLPAVTLGWASGSIIVTLC